MKYEMRFGTRMKKKKSLGNEGNDRVVLTRGHGW